jgi:hypothetical protein
LTSQADRLAAQRRQVCGYSGLAVKVGPDLKSMYKCPVMFVEINYTA